MPVELDTEVFVNAYEQAEMETDEESKLSYLMKACRVYQGDFLPELGGEEWVAIACADYQKNILNV